MWNLDNAFTTQSSKKKSKRAASPPPSSLSIPRRGGPQSKPTDHSEEKNEITKNTTKDDWSKGLSTSFEKPNLAMPSPTKKINQKKDDLGVTKNKYAAPASVPGAATTRTTAETELKAPPKAANTPSKPDARKKLDDNRFLERPVVRPLVEAIRGIDASALERGEHESELGSDGAEFVPVVATAVTDDPLETAERLELENLRREVASVPLVHAERQKNFFCSLKFLLPLFLVLLGVSIGVGLTAPYNTTDPPLLPCEQRCKDVVGMPVNVSGMAFKRAILQYMRNNSASPYGSIIACWDVSQVTDMSIAFASDLQDEGIEFDSDLNEIIFSSFNEPLDCWDTSSVTNMNRMFLDAHLFNSDLKSWNVSRVTDMGVMFSGAYAFQAEIGSWDVSSVIDMNQMFLNTVVFNANISSWDVSRVEIMSYMFYEAQKFNGDIAAWNVSMVTNMNSIFQGASSFNQNLCEWGDRVNVSRINASMLFFESGCQVTTDPSLGGSSWCQVCAF